MPPRQRTVVVVPRPARRPQRKRGGGKRTAKPKGFVSTQFEFVTASLVGSASGTIKFGPNNTESKCMKGNLQAYQKYRIVSVRVSWMTEASSTDRGVMTWHADTGCSMQPSSVGTSNSLLIRAAKDFTLGRSLISDQPWYENNKDQFWFVYKGTGSSETAGHFKFHVFMDVMNFL